MFHILRDLLRYNREFAIGVAFLGLIVVYSLLSFVSPVVPELQFVEFPDLPPSGEYWFGTNSRGQDLFWQLTFAFRNTLGFGIMVAAFSRVISITVGLVSGYVGGVVDRVLMVVNDVFVTLPAAAGPAGVLFRAGGQPQYHQPGAAYGLPRLAVRRAPDPLHRARAAPPRVHPPRDLLRDEPAEDHVRGAPPARSTRTRSARRS